jgi:hypothetical protein
MAYDTLPLRLGIGEMVYPVQMVFDFLLHELPDNYIVVDQTLSGCEVSFATGPDDYVEYDLLVLAPGLAAQVYVVDYGDLLRFDDSDSFKAEVEYLDRGFPTIRAVRREEALYWGLGLEIVVRWIAQAGDALDPGVREFFSRLKVVKTTVLSQATSEWDEMAARAMCIWPHHTRHSVVEWLQQVDDSVVFPECEWTEQKVRALVETIDSRFDWWDQALGALTRVRESLSRRTQTPSEAQLAKLISERYPFPLSFSMRRFETEPGYPEKLRCAENVLAYLGSLGIALALDAGFSLSSDEGLGKYLKHCWRKGVSAGHWVRILRETTRFLRQADGQKSAPEFPSVYCKPSGKESDLGRLLKAIPRIRNDFTHHRYPTSSDEYEEAAGKLREKLMTIYAGLRFLDAYPL